jgi:hypothetical protein
MSDKYSTVQFRLYMAGVSILIVGLFCAAWVFVAAADDSGDSNVVSYQIVAGHNYAITTTDSKRYQYDMERINGKYAVVADEINQWLSSLWHGKRLAYTIVILAIGVSLACFLIAQHPDYKLPDNKDAR